MNNWGVTVAAVDRPGLLRDLASVIADMDANIESITHVSTPEVEMNLDVSGIADPDALRDRLTAVPGVTSVHVGESIGAIFGKRVIVIGGGAQVAQVVLGAVSEADRHNIRGEHISVDTIPLVGEAKLADAVRAVARLPRAAILVLAGSLMGGDVSQAVLELRNQHGIPVICLNMVGSVTEAADLVVTDPVQAGVMAVMAVAQTATFDLSRVRGRHL